MTSACVARRLVPLTLVPLLAACQFDLGESSAAAEFARKRAAGAFHVMSVEDGRAVIMARGREVYVTPGPGACVAEDAIDLSERSAFLLLTDCALTAPVVPASTDDDRLEMGEAFPGLITLSLAGEPRADREALEAFLRTPTARRQIARAGGGGAVSVEEVRVEGDAVLVHARDGAGETALLSPDFWRGFVDLNGRMGVVTVSGFAAAAMPSDAMYAELMRQVRALEGANGQIVDAGDVEALIGTAAATPAAPEGAATGPAIASLTDEVVVLPTARPERAPPSELSPELSPELSQEALEALASASGLPVPMPPVRPAR